MAALPSTIPPVEHLLTEWAVERRPVYDAVLGTIGITGERCKGLIPPLVNLVVDYLEAHGQVFGAREWTDRFGVVVPAAPLLSLRESLFQRLKETHVLVYIPKTVNGEPLTLKSLEELVKKHFSNSACNFILDPTVDTLKDNSIEKSCWALMTKDILPKSRSKCYADQQAIVANFSAEGLTGYEVPTAIEAAICLIFRKSISSINNPDDDLEIYTRCQERTIEGARGFQVAVGNFVSNKLNIDTLDYLSKRCGVAGMRKFF